MGKDPCLGELPAVPHGFATGRVVWKETFPNFPSQQKLPGPGREFPAPKFLNLEHPPRKLREHP